MTFQDGQVVAVGQGRPPVEARDLGNVALLPGLVNAHTHLELTWMAGKVPPADSMDDWIQTLLAVRRTGPAAESTEVTEGVTRAIGEMRATGTSLVGDVSNTLISAPILAMEGMDATVFHEILGFNPVDPAGLVRDAWHRIAEADEKRRRVSFTSKKTPDVFFGVVGHAPYSTAPALFTEIAARHEGRAPLAVHLAESHEEMEFLHTGRGPIRQMLETLGVWNAAWKVPACGAVEFLENIGYLLPGTLLVHGVHLTLEDLDRARAADAVVVTCPRSNVWVGGGVPPVSRFYGSGVAVAIGTDSLASTDSLNMFDELAALRRLAPEVDAARLLDSATRVGAEALGFGQQYGTIAPGRSAELVSVALPAGVGARAGDVEEYLVSGVPAAAISWLDA
ncbi:MAG: amidohydrolase family protein [Acidobacteria bacterium]|nr:amidohydrolase family protein [Acidobacteriota bacterium]